MHILVTGCAGFIGHKAAELLLKRGDDVTGVDNLNDYYDPRLKEWRLSTIRDYERFSFFRYSIENRRAMEKLFQNTRPFDAVVNLAARAGIRASLDNPWLYIDTNITGTLNLLECCKKYSVRTFVLASSSSVYGLNEIPFLESDSTDTSLSPYAASKKSAEILCHAYHHLYDIEIAVLRFFTVYGPAGRPDMAIFTFIKNIDEGKPIQIYGDGKQSRDFTYIDDIADGTIQSLGLRGYTILNLGDNKPVDLMTVISLIEKALGKKADIRYCDRHAADVTATWADIHRAGDLLGWKPRIDISEGISRTVQWYLQNKPWIRELAL